MTSIGAVQLTLKYTLTCVSMKQSRVKVEPIEMEFASVALISGLPNLLGEPEISKLEM